MKVLFYIEPLIELDLPYWKLGWVNFFAKAIVESLEKHSPGKFAFSFAINEPMDERMEGFEALAVRRIVLTQRELTNEFQWSAYDLSMHWYGKGGLDGKIDEYYQKLFEKRFSGENFDLIISFSPIPFLTKLFPKAKILYHELGFVSRPPFLETVFFDPIGVGGHRYIESYWSKIAPTLGYGAPDLEAVSALKDEIRSLISRKNPFKEIVDPWRSKFEKLLLVPLQFSGAACVDGNSYHRSQLERLCDILESVPASVGVIATTHPEYPVLTRNQLEFLQKKYPNLLTSPAFLDVSSASQYLVEFVDAITGTSWSMAAQGLFWDKPTLPVRDGQYRLLSNAPNLKKVDWKDLSSQLRLSNDTLLLWLLTQFCVPRFVVSESPWLAEFISRLLTPSQPAETLFRPFAEDIPAFLAKWKAHLRREIPLQNKVVPFERLQVRIEQAERQIEDLRNELDYSRKETALERKSLAMVQAGLSESTRLLDASRADVAAMHAQVVAMRERGDVLEAQLRSARKFLVTNPLWWLMRVKAWLLSALRKN